MGGLFHHLSPRLRHHPPPGGAGQAAPPAYDRHPDGPALQKLADLLNMPGVSELIPDAGDDARPPYRVQDLQGRPHRRCHRLLHEQMDPFFRGKDLDFSVGEGGHTHAEYVQGLSVQHLPGVNIGPCPFLRGQAFRRLGSHVADRRNLHVLHRFQHVHVTPGTLARPHKSHSDRHPPPPCQYVERSAIGTTEISTPRARCQTNSTLRARAWARAKPLRARTP